MVRRPATSLFSINLFSTGNSLLELCIVFISDAGAFLPSLLRCVLRHL